MKLINIKKSINEKLSKSIKVLKRKVILWKKVLKKDRSGKSSKMKLKFKKIKVLIIKYQLTKSYIPSYIILRLRKSDVWITQILNKD